MPYRELETLQCLQCKNQYSQGTGSRRQDTDGPLHETQWHINLGAPRRKSEEEKKSAAWALGAPNALCGS